jgi:hypothetical protein
LSWADQELTSHQIRQVSIICQRQLNKVGPTDQPSARRENASSTTAKYTNSDASRSYVISATHSWLIAVSTIYWAKFR